MEFISRIDTNVLIQPPLSWRSVPALVLGYRPSIIIASHDIHHTYRSLACSDVVVTYDGDGAEQPLALVQLVVADFGKIVPCCSG